MLREPPTVEYRLDESGELWWCNSHRRRATHIRYSSGTSRAEHCCDPKRGKILLPCFAVNLTDDIELIDES